MRQQRTFFLTLHKDGQDREPKAGGTAVELLAEIAELDQVGPYELYSETIQEVVAEGDRAAIQEFLEAEVAKAPTAEELLEEASQELAAANEKVAENAAELERARSAIYGMEAELNGLDQALSHANAETRKMADERDEARREHDTIAQQIAGIAQARGALQATVENNRTALYNAEESLKAAEGELHSTSTKLAATQGVLDRTHNELDDIRKRLASILNIFGYAYDSDNISERVAGKVRGMEVRAGIVGWLIGALMIGAIWFVASLNGCGRPNQAPELSVTPAEASVEIGKSTSFSFAETDPDDKKTNLVVTKNPEIGTVTIDEKSKTLTYTPDGKTVGDDNFTIVATDGDLNSPPVEVSVTVTPTPAPTPAPTTGGNPFGEIPTTSGTR